ncbi:hypothetical protein [Pseudalkalibacillus decolorationis]|uniref:hypothetical protein n=1 Tax=Pseudalkalibacillus decolorationis TaxID=163879 RepID=UPI0021499A04|nr:hypothetical protein [Pseudalkalibacillus decolorationis]
MEETLIQILNEIKKVNNRLVNLETGQERIETKVDHLSSEMRSHFNHIEGKLDQHQAVFKVVSDEMKSVNFDVDYLSSKTGKHDTEINNIKKKLQS